jgi:alkylhydroperoxidase/carboxymuconolactone decarboxylase family protein YurZ
MEMKPEPKPYQALKQRNPEYIAAVDALRQAALKLGPINERTAHLVQLAAAAAVRSEGAVHSHVRRALEAGATPDEVRHALILLTSTIGFPNVMAALSWADDILGT